MLNKLESTPMKKPLLCHYNMIYSLSSISKGEELNGLTRFLNVTHMGSPEFQLNCFKTFNPHFGLKESTVELCSHSGLPSIYEARKP